MTSRSLMEVLQEFSDVRVPLGTLRFLPRPACAGHTWQQQIACYAIWCVWQYLSSMKEIFCR